MTLLLQTQRPLWSASGEFMPGTRRGPHGLRGLPERAATRQLIEWSIALECDADLALLVRH